MLDSSIKNYSGWRCLQKNVLRYKEKKLDNFI